MAGGGGWRRRRDPQGPDRVTTPDGVVIELRPAVAEDWAELAGDWVTSGLWPVVLAPSDTLSDWRSRILEDIRRSREAPLGRVLAEARAIDTDRLMEQWLADSTDPDDEEEDEGLDETLPGMALPSPATDIPGGGAEVLIALVPCDEPADTLGVLGFGGWNSCPRPAEHVAVMRRWAERYGARLHAMGTDTLELSISRPPTGAADAVAAARELFAFDDDLVRQGVGTVGALAKTILGSPRWWFWWD